MNGILWRQRLRPILGRCVRGISIFLALAHAKNIQVIRQVILLLLILSKVNSLREVTNINYHCILFDFVENELSKIEQY